MNNISYDDIHNYQSKNNHNRLNRLSDTYNQLSYYETSEYQKVDIYNDFRQKDDDQNIRYDNCCKCVII
jgi:hypothetical protein